MTDLPILQVTVMISTALPTALSGKSPATSTRPMRQTATLIALKEKTAMTCKPLEYVLQRASD